MVVWAHLDKPCHAVPQPLFFGVSCERRKCLLFLLYTLPSSVLTRYDLMSTFSSTWAWTQFFFPSLSGRTCTVSPGVSPCSSLVPLLWRKDCFDFCSLSFWSTSGTLGFRSLLDVGSRVLVRLPKIRWLLMNLAPWTVCFSSQVVWSRGRTCNQGPSSLPS